MSPYNYPFLGLINDLQGLHDKNWKKKDRKDFVTFLIANTLKVISVPRRN